MDAQTALPNNPNPLNTNPPQNPSIDPKQNSFKPIRQVHSYWRYIAIIFVFISLVLVGISAYLWQQTSQLQKNMNEVVMESILLPTPTLAQVSEAPVGWKMYANKYWNITLNYPSDQLTLCSSYTTEVEGGRFFESPFDCTLGTDQIYKVGVVGYLPGTYKEYKKPVKSEKILLDSEEVTKNTYVYDESDGPLVSIKESVEIVVNRKNGTLVLEQLGTAENDKKLFEQILKTFRFNSQQSTESWKTYTNTYPAYSLEYPSDWKIDTSAAEVKPIGSELYNSVVTIYSGEYKVNIVYPSAYGPSACIFDDQESLKSQYEFAGYCSGEYVEFGFFRKIRRMLNPTNDKNNIWNIYIKEKDGPLYVSVPPITYFAPANRDPAILSKMDEIVARNVK